MRLRTQVRVVDASSLAVFRIGFGTIIAWEVWRAFDGNLIRADYDLPRYTFRWWLFQWVKPLPGFWIYVAFAVLGVAAVFVAMGLFYRYAAAVTSAGIAYWFLMEKASYLNHRYLAGLIALLLIFVPADAVWSLDARRRRTPRDVPPWSLWLLRFQFGVPYFFGGIAKLNFDWLVRAEPLRSSLRLHGDFPLLGRFFDNAALAHVLAWGSTALDLFVPFLMLNRRTRVPAFGFALAFHFINSRIFEIGIFPWLMIVGSTLFFEPDWPRRLLSDLRASRRTRAVCAGAFLVGFALGGFLPETFSLVRALVGASGVIVFAYHARVRRSVERPRPDVPRLVAAWMLVQVLLPLTHFLIPGNVYWTEERNRFAWHMLVRAKTDRVAFVVTDPATERSWVVDQSRHLTRWQMSKLEVPDLILEFAHYLDAFYKRQGYEDVEVRVRAFVAMNGRRPQRLIDPSVDLSEVRRPYIPPAGWILPLKPYRATRH